MRDHLIAPRAPATLRKLLTAALLALQVALALTPLVEQPSSRRAVAHAHDQQRRHRAAHDESTCGVCAARTQVAVATDPPAPIVAGAREPGTAPTAPVPAPAFARRGIHSSRAPPALG